MKKLFTLVALALSTLCASATDYTEGLSVTINGITTPAQETTVSIDQNADGTYKLTLNNFIMTLEGNSMGIGNIVLDNVEGTTTDDVTTIKTSQTITIEDGDDSYITDGTITAWVGPDLEEVPINMIAEIRGEQAYFVIDIEMVSLGQTIKVVFGDGGYQIGNSDFESFHTATYKTATSDEPDHWHSFMSCTGTFASFVSSTPHTFIGTETRPGTSGTSSVLVTSGLVIGVVANGTLTTGRLKAGAISAASTSNNAFLDITSTDTDAYGDPFYSLLNGRPDSVSVWVKFKQGSAVEDHPYATLTAVITDGNYYQEPSDDDYSSIIVAKAADTQIASNDNAWQRLSLPFDYDSYGADTPAAILVTISTNADPGQGTGTDSLYVDDFELIYNSTVTGITVKDTKVELVEGTTDYEVTVNGTVGTVTADDIEVTTDAQGANVEIETAGLEDGSGTEVTITVRSGDLKNSSTYTLTTKASDTSSGDTDGITDVSATGGSSEVEAVYNASGQRVKAAQQGQVTITKFADGKTVKTISK